MGLSQDLGPALRRMGEADRDAFEEIFDIMHSPPPVTQEKLMTELLPLIKRSDARYKKFQKVHARQAVEGETVISETTDGEETTNTAKADDVLVRNLTEAQEEYLVEKTAFDNRYSPLEPVDDEWTLYEPLGEVMAAEITRDVTTMLDVGEEFYIVAPWESEQLARLGDMFVAPLPGLDEIYRIARKEFDETYALTQTRRIE